MTATEKLRTMLDERGVEYTTCDGEHVKETCWCYMGELTASFVEYDNGTTHFEFDYWYFTPEQAIAATLGPGTCRNISNPPDGFLCSSCGWGDFCEPSHLLTKACYEGLSNGPRHCPNCGAKVVQS